MRRWGPRRTWRPSRRPACKGSLSTATDVYGLGTILYALLAGRAPFAGTTLVETLDKVRTCSPEPPRGSTSQVPRDLEIICLKCLEKEPNRRYSSALALAEDLDRWLAGAPILARPVGPLTCAAMWCRRNKALASLAALLMLALVGGLAGVTWKWREADHERAKAEAVNELLTQRLLAQASLELDPLAKNLTVRELLDRAGHSSAAGSTASPISRPRSARRSAARISRSVSTNRPKSTFEPRSGSTPDSTAPNIATRSVPPICSPSLLDQTNRAAEAEPLLRRNLEDCRGQLGRDDPVTLDAAERLGALLWHLGKVDEAETVLRKNVDDRSRVLKPEHPDTLRSTYLLSRVLREHQQFADAEHFAYLYAHSVQCSLGSNHPDNILALTNQGDVLRDQGKLAAAEPFYRQAAVEAERIWGAEHRSTLAAVETHKRVLAEMEKRPAAQ